MKLMVLLVNLLFAHAEAALEYSCDSFRVDAPSIADTIQSLTRKKDVTEETDAFTYNLENCNITFKDLGRSNLTPTAWKNIGYESALSNIKNKIVDESEIRDVSLDINEYRRVASLAGKDVKRTEAFIKESKKYQIQGKAAADREKAACGEVDLRNAALGENRDQDTIGWCYAFSAADLLTYKLGKQISAADLAVGSNADRWVRDFRKVFGAGEQDLNGGIQSSAIESAIDRGGACLEENFRSEDNGYADLLTTLTKIDETKIKGRKLFRTSVCMPAVTALFPKLLTEDVLKIAESSGRANLINRLNDKACGERISLKDLQVKSKLGVTTKEKIDAAKLMDEQLSLFNIVSITVTAEALQNSDTTKNQSNHAVTVVGRRFNSKSRQCEYLVRNSWGRSCAGYDRRLDCEEGNIWIPKSQIIKTRMFEVTYVN